MNFIDRLKDEWQIKLLALLLALVLWIYVAKIHDAGKILNFNSIHKVHK